MFRFSCDCLHSKAYCRIQSCSLRMPSFWQVGRVLKLKYQTAIKVRLVALNDKSHSFFPISDQQSVDLFKRKRKQKFYFQFKMTNLKQKLRLQSQSLLYLHNSIDDHCLIDSIDSIDHKPRVCRVEQKSSIASFWAKTKSNLSLTNFERQAMLFLRRASNENHCDRLCCQQTPKTKFTFRYFSCKVRFKQDKQLCWQLLQVYFC